LLLVSIDGFFADPDKTIIEVEYSANKGQNAVDVSLTFAEHGFKTAWGKQVTVILPVTDKRGIKGGSKSHGKIGWRG